MHQPSASVASAPIVGSVAVRFGAATGGEAAVTGHASTGRLYGCGSKSKLTARPARVESASHTL